MGKKKISTKAVLAVIRHKRREYQKTGVSDPKMPEEIYDTSKKPKEHAKAIRKKINKKLKNIKTPKPKQRALEKYPNAKIVLDPWFGLSRKEFDAIPFGGIKPWIVLMPEKKTKCNQSFESEFITIKRDEPEDIIAGIRDI